MKLISDNENKKVSRNKKRRKEHTDRMNDDMKILLKKLNLKREK